MKASVASSTIIGVPVTIQVTKQAGERAIFQGFGRLSVRRGVPRGRGVPASVPCASPV
jgi:hypothetical protein